MNVKISVRALEARMKRHLLKSGIVLRKCKADSRWYQELGEYYAVSASNEVSHKDVNLEEWARESGVLKPFEIVAND